MQNNLLYKDLCSAFCIQHINLLHKLADKNQIHKAHSFEHMFFIYQCVFNALENNNIDGDIFEFGVYTGVSTALLNTLANITNKKLYCFDSFTGLPDINLYGSKQQQQQYKTGAYKADLQTVTNNLLLLGSNIVNIKIFEGLFNKSFNTIFNNKIAFCFIDVDLILSVEQCLEFVIPKLQKNGIIFCHEFDDVDNLILFKKFDLFNSDKWKFEQASIANINDGAISKLDIGYFQKLN